MLFDIIELIVNAFATILGGALLLRFWMQAMRVRPPNSLGQVIFSLSDWLVRPLRRIVPGVGGYDWASLIGALLVVALATTVYLLRPMFTVDMYVVKTLYRFLTWLLYGLMALLFAEVIFSWVNPHAPAAPFVRALNEPLLRHLRRLLPPVGGLDWSVLVATILIVILQMILAAQFPLYVR